MKNFVCGLAALTWMACGANVAQDGKGDTGSLRCGAGTRIEGSECVPFEVALRCGAGTRVSQSQCLPEDGLTCGAGTVLQGKACVAQGGDALCGAGTTLVSGECRVDLTATCGSDTKGAAGQCVTKLSCGSGTSRVGDACVASGATGCGAGTVEKAGKCEVDASKVCGAGTTLRNGKCEAGAVVNSSLSALAADPMAKAAFYAGTSYDTRFMLTGLAQSSADSWVDISASPVADGVALHVSHYNSFPASSTMSRVDVIRNDTDSSGACLASVQPDMSGTGSSGNDFHVSFYEWKGGSPQLKACAKAGSVRVDRVSFGGSCTYGSGCVKVTLNAAFSDGTILEDKVFYAAVR